jgi:flagellar assembly protein FliH
VHAALDRAPDRPAPAEEADASLREKLRNLEAQAAVERREALESGRRQGEQQARAELQPVLERLNSSITEIAGMRADIRRRAEQDVVQLALLIAKRVLHRELQVDTEALTALARVAFERLARAESYRVTVHPQFAAAVTSALSINNRTRVHVDPDPDCAPGTLIIHSADGTVDASIETQLEEIGRGLTDRITRVEGD